MRGSTRRLLVLGMLVLLLGLIFAFNPFSTGPSLAATTWRALTTDWSNVRTGPSTRYSIAAVDAPDTLVTVYATVSGQVVWGGISNWDRISPLSSSPLYIYSGLLTLASQSAPGGGNPPSGSSQGKEIVVSLSRQWLWAYQNGRLVFNSAVMTGRPALPTPTGTYHVFSKFHPTWFYSPWPPGSPYWYPPTFINYALQWRTGGFFLHDSWWHTVYGPGTNEWHYDPRYGWQWGTHGCVAMPLSSAAWLYNWAPIGTTVQVNP